MIAMVESALTATQIRVRIAALVTRSLVEEVYITPKPGLVDQVNSGSHQDMDYLLSSAAALEPFWSRFFVAGQATAHALPMNTL